MAFRYAIGCIPNHPFAHLPCPRSTIALRADSPSCNYNAYRDNTLGLQKTDDSIRRRRHAHARPSFAALSSIDIGVNRTSDNYLGSGLRCRSSMTSVAIHSFPTFPPASPDSKQPLHSLISILA
ncbi:hypothetical protein FRC02_006881 [Tulasnella sp. 418]|nr:hypothetical protein FRC02_006881 [Tulasnella sp. 418]